MNEKKRLRLDMTEKMGSGVPSRIENIVHLMGVLDQLASRGRIPLGLVRRLEALLAAVEEHLDSYAAIAERFDARTFEEVAKRVEPYYLTMLSTDRSGKHRGLVDLHGVEPAEPEESITVDVYLTSGDPDADSKLLKYVDNLAMEMGYDQPTEIGIEFGSIFRRAKAAVVSMFGSRELQDRFAALEQAAVNYVYQERQANINLTLATAFAHVMDSLREQPEASVRVGSLLILKYEGETGPVVLTRMLSVSEIQALEKLPGIQKNPSLVLQNLALATAEEESANRPSIP